MNIFHFLEKKQKSGSCGWKPVRIFPCKVVHDMRVSVTRTEEVVVGSNCDNIHQYIDDISL